MKRWKGLFVKEWLLMRRWGYVTVGMTVLLTFIVPVVLTLSVSATSDFVREGFLLISPLWLFVVVFIPTIILMVSLGEESIRPDVWLHSPASIFTLFGVKVLFSLVIGFVNFFVTLFLLIVTLGLRVYPFDYVYEQGTFTFWFLFLGMLLLVSIVIACVSLFFRVVYGVIRPVMKKVTGFVTVGLLIIFIWLGNLVMNTSFYVKISQLGSFGGMAGRQFYLKEDDAYFMIDDSFFYVGELVMSIGFMGLLFIVSSVLFERGVRG